MKSIALSAVLAVAMFANANAQDATASASATMQTAFEKVCKSTFVLSEKAKAACDGNTMPKTNKAGTSFRNVGIGTEFNTLIRNMK